MVPPADGTGDPADFGAVLQYYEWRKDVPNTTRGVVDHAYTLRFGATSQGDPTVVLEGSGFTPPSSFGAAGGFVIPGSGYHLYELIFKRRTEPGLFNEGGGTATLYVDGDKKYENYVGWDVLENPAVVSTDSDQILFGNYGTLPGNMNVSFVNFELGEDLQPGIPEPATAGLLVTGAMAWFGFPKTSGVRSLAKGSV